MGKNNRAARAARTLVQFCDVDHLLKLNIKIYLHILKIHARYMDTFSQFLIATVRAAKPRKLANLPFLLLFRDHPPETCKRGNISVI